MCCCQTKAYMWEITVNSRPCNEMFKKRDCCALNLTVRSLLADPSKSDQTVLKLLGCYVSPRMSKFVSPHTRGHLVMDMLSWGSRGSHIQQQASYLERLVLSAPLLGYKSFKSTHYLTIVVQSPLFS